MNATASPQLLSAEDVGRRWGVAVEYVWEAVDDPESPLPFIYLGRGTPRRGIGQGRGKGKGGQRGLYRFRVEAVEAWERARERAFKAADAARDEAAVAELAASGGHDGKVRGGRKGRQGPRAK